MARLLGVLAITLLDACLVTPAIAQVAAQAQWPQASVPGISVDLLSDTHGTYVDAYLKALLPSLRTRWMALATRAQAGPLVQTGDETILRVTIAPDGQITAMKLEKSADENTLDQAAWSATKSMPFGSLPAGMGDSSLTMRVHFVAR